MIGLKTIIFCFELITSTLGFLSHLSCFVKNISTQLLLSLGEQELAFLESNIYRAQNLGAILHLLSSNPLPSKIHCVFHSGTQ